MSNLSITGGGKNLGRLLNAGLLLAAILLLLALYRVISKRLDFPDLAFYFLAIMLILGICGAVFVCFRPVDSKINFMLSAGFSVVGLFFVETGIQTYQYFQLEKVNFDSRSAAEVIAEYRANGDDLWSFEIPPFHLQQENFDKGKVIALSSMSNTKVITCNETGQWNIIKTDEYGFNNPSGLKSDQKTDVILIGDSFAHGGCTPGNKNIGHYLREHGRSVRNLGVMGSGPVHQLAVLSEYGPLYEPNVVLWFYYEGNDLGDLLHESGFAMLNQYKNSGYRNQLSSSQRSVDEYLMAYQKAKLAQMKDWRPAQDLGIFKKIAKLEAVRRLLGLMGYQIDAHRITANSAQVWSEFKIVAQSLKSITESWGGKLKFVYLPDGTRFDRVQRFDYWKNDLESIIKKLDIPFLDYYDDLKNDPDPLSSFNLHRPAHLSASGNERLAKFLVAKSDLVNRKKKQ